MSNYLKSLNKEELKHLVNKFGAVPVKDTRDASVDALLEKGVSDEQAKEALSARKAALEKANPNYREDAVKKDDKVMLIKMRRANPTFEFRNYRFTKENPFVLMREDDASALLSFERGFVTATPQEAREYYGTN